MTDLGVKLPCKRELEDKVTIRAVEQSNDTRPTISPEIVRGYQPPRIVCGQKVNCPNGARETTLGHCPPNRAVEQGKKTAALRRL